MIEQSMIERVAWAMHAEEDRWRCITGGTGMQDVIVRDDDDGQPVEISRHPQGDGGMWFWDTRNRAVAAAAIKAMREPTEEQWGGLARQIIMWMDMQPKTPRALFTHLERSGVDVPHWLRDDPEMQALDHVPSKGTRAVIVYRAMIDAALVGEG